MGDFVRIDDGNAVLLIKKAAHRALPASNPPSKANYLHDKFYGSNLAMFRTSRVFFLMARALSALLLLAASVASFRVPLSLPLRRAPALRAKIANDVTELIGNTPMVRLSKVLEQGQIPLRRVFFFLHELG